MSQFYNCLITQELLSVPDELPHFTSNGLIYIPLDVVGQHVREFIERFEDGMIRDDLSIATDPDCDTPYYYDPTAIFEVVQRLDLTYREFALYHSSDWDVPIEHHEGLFRNGKIVVGTKHIANEWDTLDTIIGKEGAIFPFFGLNWDTFLTFHSYKVAESEYKKSRQAKNRKS